MNRINQYEPIQCLQKFNQNIQLWLCENTEGDHFDVLTISKNESYERSLKRILSNEVKPLIDREISGFQKIVDVGFDSEQNVHYVAYKHFEGTPLNDNNAHVGTLKEIVKGLDELKKENKQAFILSPKYMIIDAMGMVKTRFVGLFELFRRENLLEEDYLSPNVQEWMNDTKHPRPNFQDDMYSLGKIFQNTLLKNHGEVGIRILEKCLALQRIERFSKYYELLELLEKIAIPKRKSSLGTIQIKTQQDWNDPKFKALLQSMNEQTWFLVDNERSKSKNQITGRFSTSDYNGRFFVDEQNYLFIDFKGCKEGKDDWLVKQPESFLAYFSFDSSPHRFDCVSVFKEKFDERNHLAQLHNNKKDAVKHWQTLPDKEREYIEERAFKAAYTKRTQSGNEATNIKFHLTEPTHKDWNRVKNLKNEEVVLFIDDQKIGKILDFHPQDKFIIIGDPYCSIDEIPKQGELIEDVRQETSQYKKQVEACKKFEKSDVINPSLCSILATPDRTAMPKTSFLKGWEYDNFKDELFDKKLKNDKTQCEAVLEALHHKPVYLIQGPPGTGKTTVIVELIRQLVKRQKDVKILVTSQSNLAVDNVLERLEKVNNEDPNNELKFMRLASEHAVEKESITPTISPYVFENKLKNWVGETEERSNAYFSQHFAKQEKQKVVIEFYQFFSQL
ncbi:MAG: AAA domain-containing protein, partial [Chitinophagales bacterium]